MKNFIRENWFKIAILIVVAFSLMGYFSYLNEKNALVNAKNLEEKLKRDNNELSLSFCLDDTDSLYTSSWDRACEGLDKEKDCSLPSSRADDLDNDRRLNREECFKRYPIK